MRHHLFTIVVATFLSGCATGPSLLQTRLDALPESQRGYITGTFSVDCKFFAPRCIQAFNSITATYRMQSDPSVVQIFNWTYGSIFGPDTTHDYLDPTEGHKGFHFCVPLPPEKFEIYSISYYNFAGGGSGYSVGEKDYFSVPFQVKAGEVTNLGRIRLTTTTGKNIFGMSLNVPGEMVLSESSAAEAGAAMAKCPVRVQELPSTSQALRVPVDRPTPFVRSTNP